VAFSSGHLFENSRLFPPGWKRRLYGSQDGRRYGEVVTTLSSRGATVDPKSTLSFAGKNMLIFIPL
jgi:hypothetical protein